MNYFEIILNLIFNLDPTERTKIIDSLRTSGGFARDIMPMRKEQNQSQSSSETRDQQFIENQQSHKLKMFKIPSIKKQKKILCLDLDETLVHSTPQSYRRHDFSVEVMIDKHVCL